MTARHPTPSRPWGLPPAPAHQPRLLLVVEPVALSGGLPHELRRTWTRRAPRWLVALAAAGVALGVGLLGAAAAHCATHPATATPPGSYAPPAPALRPASGEEFYPTTTWTTIEPLLWREATAAGMRGAERAMLLSLAWSESRGRALAVGDAGCSVGIGQLALGGSSYGGRPCHADVRRSLPEPYRSMARSSFFDPQTNVRAAILLLRARGSERDPWGALAGYAGCAVRDGRCARGGLDERGRWQPGVLQLHHHWLISGLWSRVARLEGGAVAGVAP